MRSQAGIPVPKLELVLVPKLQLGNPALEAPASRKQGSENTGRGNVTGCVHKQE